MFSLQIVKFDDINDLTTVGGILNSFSKLDEQVDDVLWPEHEFLIKRWVSNTGQLTSGTQETNHFILAEGYNERCKRKDSWFEDGVLVPKEDRINTTRYQCIFFEYDNSVYMTALMPLSVNLNTFCNDLLPQDSWGKIQKAPSNFTLSKDFFYWLLNAFTASNRKLSDTPRIEIRSWTGFRGYTQDTTHKLSGEGERISAILGTLAFLFMDDQFKSLSISIQYENERIPVHLYADGSLSIHDFEYEGIYANAYQDNNRVILLTILMYTKVLPALSQAYIKAKETDAWNENEKEKFRKYIGEQIMTRVKEELLVTT
ncbi:hypothetical protein M5W68_00020 [Paenibacillus larvae]|uniref:hypothetical protein n=1 Tax=Paenibacillus larvae TaxID=1464 RepID=UPI00227DDDE0|nr:hypothetical protein [Paenibacillus larvae]MCY9511976.1 hypothetical protein [Paenibacillus larvae]MCY9523593.1 hypothetical protein [Paenibacillus larvae]